MYLKSFRLNDILYINITPSITLVYFRMIPVHRLLLRTGILSQSQSAFVFSTINHERTGFTGFSDSPLSHKKLDQRNGIIPSYSTSTTSSSCRHGCFTEDIPEELEYLPKSRWRYVTSSYK